MNFEEFLESNQYGMSPTTPKSTGTRTKSQEIDNARSSELQSKTQYQGWTIHSSIHAQSQARDRRHDLKTRDWKELHRRAIGGLTKHHKSGAYIFYSRSMEQGYVANVDTSKKQIRLITVLPKGKSAAKEGTERLVIENIEILCVIVID